MKLFFLFCITTSLCSEERYLESLYPAWGQSFEISQVIHREKSDYWDLIIFENPLFGRVLAIDGTIQTTEADEAIYHEMMAHIPLLSHANPTSVLIIGGGDGGILREVLRHPTVQKALLVEIDPRVIELSKQFLPALPGQAFEDPRTQVIIQDATRFVKETEETFDVIICDSTDPVGPAKALFSEEFYGDCKKCLKKDGIFVNQNGVPFLQSEELLTTRINRSPHFKHTTYYVAAVPSYVGGLMTLGWASDKKYRFSVTAIEKRLSTITGKMKYYTPEIHRAAFALPQFMLKTLQE